MNINIVQLILTATPMNLTFAKGILTYRSSNIKFSDTVVLGLPPYENHIYAYRFVCLWVGVMSIGCYVYQLACLSVAVSIGCCVDRLVCLSVGVYVGWRGEEGGEEE